MEIPLFVASAVGDHLINSFSDRNCSTGGHRDLSDRTQNRASSKTKTPLEHINSRGVLVEL
ncbi:hypothetical protein F7734_45290 [Scytonema sp. UIC 10036]|uniref:hypothetical protein n=1 Tax=Scytonema sp. UIC 10036 TaxID=2304196 RepID=UPI0012DA0C52|nr:hypothetical protein [Scytonema sp. UIC 10036]MUG99127.1 hypothetical protein [Scytonema sp. UIC 10036]